MMNEDDSKFEDLTLPATRGLRGKPHLLLKDGKVIAKVHKNFNRWNANNGFAHPTLELFVRRTWSDGSDDDRTLLTVTFQRNNMNRGSEYDVNVAGPLEDLEFGGQWSQCYGANIEGRLEYSQHLAVGLQLLERASEAWKWQSLDEEGNRSQEFRDMSAIGCQLLTLIHSLRKIGIPVTIVAGKRKKVVQSEATQRPVEYTLTMLDQPA